MCDYVLDMELATPEEDALLMDVLRNFVSDRTVPDADEIEGPALMLRPLINERGSVGKRIVFQSEAWLKEFSQFWEQQKVQAVWG